MVHGASSRNWERVSFFSSGKYCVVEKIGSCKSLIWPRNSRSFKERHGSATGPSPEPDESKTSTDIMEGIKCSEVVLSHIFLLVIAIYCILCYQCLSLIRLLV
jgi:hypothetical protein